MRCEIVRFETEDGMFLDGAFTDAAERADSSWPGVFDSVLLIHGVGSNFYQPRLLTELSHYFATNGLAAFRINTRGHDTIHTVRTRDGARLQGSALEVVDECRFDINAALRVLANRGKSRVLLLGHSLGAIKSVYWGAHLPTGPDGAPVAGILALSPPRLSASRFRDSDNPRYFEAIEKADSLVRRGRGEQLISIEFPFPMEMSAQTFVDKYGGERYNILDLVVKLPLPTLFTYGELELSNVAFQGLPDELEARATSVTESSPIRIQIVPGADHNYQDCGPLLNQLESYCDRWNCGES